jgi:hypothetical protein
LTAKTKKERNEGKVKGQFKERESARKDDEQASGAGAA